MTFKTITKDNLETAVVENLETLQQELANHLPQEGRVKLTADLNAFFGTFHNVQNYGKNSAFSNLPNDELPLASPFVFATFGTLNSDETLQFINDPLFAPLFDVDLAGTPSLQYVDVATGASNLGSAAVTSFTSNAVLEGDRFDSFDGFELYRQRGFSSPHLTHVVADPTNYYNQNIYTASVNTADIPSFDLGLAFSWWSGCRFLEFSSDGFERGNKYCYLHKANSVEYRKENNSNISIRTLDNGLIIILARFGTSQVWQGLVQTEDYWFTDSYYTPSEDGSPQYYCSGSFVQRGQYEKNVMNQLPKGSGIENTKPVRMGFSYDPTLQASYPTVEGKMVNLQINNYVIPLQMYPVSGTLNGTSGLVGFRNRGVLTFNGGDDLNFAVQQNSVLGGFTVWPRALNSFELIGAYYRGY